MKKKSINVFSSKSLLERSTIEGDSPVYESQHNSSELFSSTTRLEKPSTNLPALSGKAKYFQRSIVNKYREGKVKSRPVRPMK